jgi:DNA-binding transcriptional LysR family regulator
MDKLNQYRVFAQVAEMGSFIKAAYALGLPRASVSAAIQQLESEAGTCLLHRTTRQVRLTDDGARLLDRVRPFLANAEELDQLFHTSHRSVSGRLNVDVPSRIARRLIAPALPAFLRRYPQLELTVGSSDRFIDLVKESVDCAVRIGSIPDNSLVVDRLGEIGLINCASPGYLRECGAPTSPGELSRSHWTVGYVPTLPGRELSWEFGSSDRGLSIAVRSRVTINNAESYIACCVAGVGLIQIPRFDVQHLLDRGELVEVMPDFRPAPMQVSLIYSHRRQRSRRLVAFTEWFSMLMKPHLEPVTSKVPL